MSQDMSKCSIAYAFKSSRNLLKFLVENKIQPNNLFLASIKPRKNKKGEVAYPYNGSKVALCKIVNTESIAGGIKYCETTINVAEMKNGMDIFYASKRVSGENIKEWIEEAYELDQDDFPELPEFKKPLSKAQIEQRKYAGAGKATQAMVDNLEKMLEEKDKVIVSLNLTCKELKTTIRELKQEVGEGDDNLTETKAQVDDLIDEKEALEKQLKEKDEEIAKHKAHIENLQAFPPEDIYEEMKTLMSKNEDLEEVIVKQREAIDTYKDLVEEMKDYEMYKAFFEKFKNATKAKAWIAEYQQ